VAEEEAKVRGTVATPEGPAGVKSGESAWTGLLKEGVKALIPIVLTGASLIGFVAFAGAVIVWTRFLAIGVPPDQAVKAVPRDELVATGSSLLLLFGFFGILAVLATFLVDRGGRATPGMSCALLILVAVEGSIAVVLVDDVSLLTKIGFILGFLVFIGVAIVATFDKRFAVYSDVLRPRDGETEKPQRGPDSLHTYKGDLRVPVWMPVLSLLLLAGLAAVFAVLVSGDLTGIWLAVAWLLLARLGLSLSIILLAAWKAIETSRSAEKERGDLEAKAWRENRERDETGFKAAVRRRWEEARGSFQPNPGAAPEKEAKRESRRRPHRLELRFWGVCLLSGLALAAIVVPAAVLHRWWVATSFGVAFLLAVGLWRVAVLPKPGFMWYGLAVFLSVPLFGTCTLMTRNVSDPQVQPVAIIRATDGPGESIQGIYVTEGDDRVYFVSVATEGCLNDVSPHSGRLLWVPKSEVVAMAVGPLEDVDEAGRSAIEMSDALTPDVETPTGELVNLAIGRDGQKDHAESADEPSVEASGEAPAGGDGGEKKKASKEGEEATAGKEANETGEASELAEAAAGAEAGPTGHRLENGRPAVRPNFGEGIKIVPANAEPGDVVELRMSVPNAEVDGFGPTPSGYNLRLNGVRLAVLRVPAVNVDRAEYVKTVAGKVLPLEWYDESEASRDGYVRLKAGSALKVEDGQKRSGLTLRVRDADTSEPSLAPASGAGTQNEKLPTVTLPNGEREELKRVLLRRAWSPTRIKFRVPENASTGVVSVECGQLAGQPVLTVVHPPTARVAVHLSRGSRRVSFDASHSEVDAAGEFTRHWTIAGRNMGNETEVSTLLPPRLAPYKASLTVTDSRGLADTVELRVLRLPASRFPLGSDQPASREDVRRVRDALRAAIADEKPVAIELDGHADSVGSDRDNLILSLQRVRRLRHLLFASRGIAGGADDRPQLINHGASVPMILRAFGESCPVVVAPGPQEANRRVEVFLLGPGATVASGNGCHANRVMRTSW